jgi:hypothetical protein
MRLRNPLASTRLSLLSERAPDDCYATLTHAVQERASLPSGGTIGGKVERREFSVFVVRALKWFPTTAAGKLVPVRAGTRVDLSLGPPKWALICLLAAMLAYGLCALALHQWVTTVFWIVVLLLQFWLPRWFAWRDESQLLVFLRETLAARVIEPRVRVADGNAYREVAEDPALEEIEVETGGPPTVTARGRQSPTRHSASADSRLPQHPVRTDRR